MKLYIEARCDLGCQRTSNEDMILIGEERFRDASHSMTVSLSQPKERFVLAVADGMGGAAAGELASEYALQMLIESNRMAPADVAWDAWPDRLESWAKNTHANLLLQGQRNPAWHGMGTTAVGLLCAAGKAWRFHAGDSRIYRYRAGELEQITTDHSAREARQDVSVASNLLLNSLGGANNSWLECVPLEGDLLIGDRLLLCSDGLHDVIEYSQIKSAMAGSQEAGARLLVQMARDAGGPDNISVLLVDVSNDIPANYKPLSF